MFLGVLLKEGSHFHLFFEKSNYENMMKSNDGIFFHMEMRIKLPVFLGDSLKWMSQYIRQTVHTDFANSRQ